MYIPKTYEETELTVLFDLIRNHNFAVLFSSHDGQPSATHLPFMLDADRGANGTLIAHFARANPHWRTLAPHQDVLVVFQGPHTYISPTWYAQESVVPTWNYAAVHATGRATVIHDEDVLRAMMVQLVQQHDPAIDADCQLPENLLSAIVGIEIPIDTLEGKFKFSQNKSLADQQGVIAALEQSNHSADQAVAQIMKRNLRYYMV